MIGNIKLEHNILDKVISVEDANGNTILSFRIDNKGNIIEYNNGDVADVDNDYIFNTDKELIRIQQIEEN